MDLLKQYQSWNENEEYQKIIDAIEALDEKERSPEIDTELARAYNNIAEPTDTELFEKAFTLLKSHAEYFKDNPSWHFRMGYACYYLDKEHIALKHFEMALELAETKALKEDCLSFIDECIKSLSFPTNRENFAQKTLKAWELFEKEEEKLRKLISEKHQDNSPKIAELCQFLLAPAFDNNLSFEIGFNGEKYELILTPEGRRYQLFELSYFKEHAPKSIAQYWDIIVGRKTSLPELSLSSFGHNISADDVSIWVETIGESKAVSLKLYCEKLLELLETNEGQAWWILSTKQ